MPRSLVALVIAGAAVASFSVGTARAQSALELNAYGLRAGASLDDALTQFLVGGQLDLGRPYDNLRVQSLLTVGFGDDALSFLVGGEAHYLFPVSNQSSVAPYAGGGVGLHHVNLDDGGDNTEAALLLTAGFDVPAARWWGYFAEARFLLADESVFRLEGGINWIY